MMSMKSRILTSFILAAAAVLTIGCGSDKAESAAANAQTERIIYPETTDAEPLKIGYTFWDMNVDGFIIDQANQIKLVSDAINVDLLFNPDQQDLTADGIVKCVQYFADQDVDGIVVVNFSDESMLEISRICEENEIPFMQATRTINDPEIASVVEANKYYVGRMHEDDYIAAYTVGQKLIDNGAKNILLIGPDKGDIAYEARAEGFRDACEDPSVSIIAEEWGENENDEEAAAKRIAEVMKAHPEVDGIFAIRCGFIPCIESAKELAGISEELPIVGVDFDSTFGEYYENGTLLAAAGGHHADASLTLITLVNAIRGAYDPADYPLDIENNMMMVEGAEEFAEYCKWCIGYDEDFDNRQILNANDARGLCVDYNPSTTIEDMMEFAKNNSIYDVQERHAGIVE